MCFVECDDSADCVGGAVCTLGIALESAGWTWLAACHAPLGGTSAVGEACSGPAECASNVCVDHLCTVVCSTDADCTGSPLPACTELPPPSGWQPRPTPPWRSAFPRVCR